MSRRRKAVKRVRAIDARYNSPLVTHLVSTIMRCGKKTVAQGIVTQHGGTIAASNRAEGGASLEVLLPAARGL